MCTDELLGHDFFVFINAGDRRCQRCGQVIGNTYGFNTEPNIKMDHCRIEGLKPLCGRRMPQGGFVVLWFCASTVNKLKYTFRLLHSVQHYERTIHRSLPTGVCPGIVPMIVPTGSLLCLTGPRENYALSAIYFWSCGIVETNCIPAYTVWKNNAVFIFTSWWGYYYRF